MSTANMDQILDAEQFRRHVISTKQLPTIPVVLTKVLELVEDINSSIFDLEQVILNDQSMAARVLGLSNSAFYAFGRKIHTISQAIIVIGFNAVKNLAIGVTIFSKFYDQVQDGRIDIDGLWMHSVATAECARLIVERLRLGSSEIAFICGLLHDIGRVAMIAIVPDQYSEVAKEAEREQRSLLEVEKEAFEIDHTVTGSWVAERWHLPPELVSSISHHHSPGYNREHAELVHIIQLADHLTKKLGVGVSPDSVVQPLDRHTLTTLNLSAGAQRDIEESLFNQREKIEQFFQILT